MRVAVVAAVLIALIAVAAATPIRVAQFEVWARKFGKTYASQAERSQRALIFSRNMDFIESWNETEHGFSVGMNAFGDLTSEEFAARFNGYRGADRKADPARLAKPAALSSPLPASVDWRTKGAVTPVKNQGQCGSCWSFSATGSMEGAHQIATGNLVSLSEQNLMDCSDKYGDQGCNGGLMDDAFKYVIANKGDDTEASYPYTGQDGKCHFSAANVGATISNYHDVPSGNETALQQYVATVGPVSVAIDASLNSFQFYTKGIYYASACGSAQKDLDHGVLAVGYGATTATSNNLYWIVKNSWGATWGQQGYIWMARNRSNNCGIATAASFPIV